MNLLDFLQGDNKIFTGAASDPEKKPKQSGEKVRCRTWSIILYDDAESELNFNKVLALVRQIKRCNVVYCRHEKDTEDDGTPKKPHFHLLFRTVNPYYNTGLIRYLKLTNSKQIEAISSYKRMLRYFIHIDDIDKYQYKPDEISLAGDDCCIADFYRFIEEDSEKTTDADYLRAVINLWEQGKLTNYYSILIWSMENDFYNNFKKNQRIIENLLKRSI